MMDVDTLQRVLASFRSTLVVIDSKLDVLSRAWCAAEVFEAAVAGKELHFAGQLPERFRLADGLQFRGLNKCETSHHFDKTKLLSYYSQLGVPNFDERAGDLLVGGLVGDAWGRAARAGDMEAMATLLKRGADVNTRLSRQRDTALTW